MAQRLDRQNATMGKKMGGLCNVPMLEIAAKQAVDGENPFRTGWD